ncbi:hypothetical protein Leryth_012777 [Lithospermum erythrorhizon]|nr:hypothetical protein Leryth_012777 [Lithospermum erythrorhizon]
MLTVFFPSKCGTTKTNLFLVNFAYDSWQNIVASDEMWDVVVGLTTTSTQGSNPCSIWRMFPLFFHWMLADDDDVVLLVLDRMKTIIKLMCIRNSPYLESSLFEYPVIAFDGILEFVGNQIESAFFTGRKFKIGLMSFRRYVHMKKAMGKILTRDHSRGLLYFDNPKNVIRLLPTNTPVSVVLIRRIPRVPADMPLYDILNEFQKGSSHMAAVVKVKSKKPPLSIEKNTKLKQKVDSGIHLLANYNKIKPK